jgi:uncharacterized protein with FMN-binding domain
MKYNKLEAIVKLLACAAIIAAIALAGTGRLCGHDLFADKAEVGEIDTSAQTFTFSTEGIADDVRGFAGATPLQITVADGKIADIKPLRNAETPDFFNQVASDLIPQYVGMTPQQVLDSDVDAITGATYSSRAVKQTMSLAAAHILDVEAEQNQSAPLTAAFWASLVVVLAAAIVPIFYKNRVYRIIQLILNVCILGFWSGTFISYTLMVNAMSNGFELPIAIVAIIMLVVAFIYPFFGRTNHYCTWVCPLGSLQELAGKCTKSKLKIGPLTMRWLGIFRDLLWSVLMIMSWCGIWLDWMNYELFTAFIFSQASVWVIAVAIAFVILSLFVNRPYCRFVCPTGYLARLATPSPQNKPQKNKTDE